MNDTARIERPLFCRRIENRGGRTVVDQDGRRRTVRTRADDGLEESGIALLDTGALPAERPVR